MSMRQKTSSRAYDTGRTTCDEPPCTLVGPRAEPPEFLTITQAAQVLGIGIKALRGAVGRGEIPVYRLGTSGMGRPRVHVPEVRTWALGTRYDPFARVRASAGVAAREI